MKQPVIWIVGASGYVGTSCVETLMRQGFLVVGSSRKNTAPENLSLSGWIQVDVLEEGALVKAAKRIEAEHGPIAGLVYAAGHGLDVLAWHASQEEVSRLLAAHLGGALAACRAVLPSMMLQGGGSIVLLSSLAAARPRTGQTVYAAAKGAVEALTRSLARELAAKGIRVNAVAPGFLEGGLAALLPEAERDRIRKEIPLARFGTAAETAALAGYLLSSRSGYVTGQVLGVDGGASM